MTLIQLRVDDKAFYMLTTGSNDSLTDNNEKFHIRALYQGVISFQAYIGTNKFFYLIEYQRQAFHRWNKRTLIIYVIFFSFTQYSIFSTKGALVVITV